MVVPPLAGPAAWDARRRPWDAPRTPEGRSPFTAQWEHTALLLACAEVADLRLSTLRLKLMAKAAKEPEHPTKFAINARRFVSALLSREPIEYSKFDWDQVKLLLQALLVAGPATQPAEAALFNRGTACHAGILGR